jgi:peptidoglycan/LPS O-acetylase OafA/YrhL
MPTDTAVLAAENKIFESQVAKPNLLLRTKLRSDSGYIPALDGLRGLSILLVIYGHLSRGTLPHFMRASTLGTAGVIMFFVISGYVITLQLIKERNHSKGNAPQ